MYQWLVRLPSSAQTDSETIHLSNHHYLNNNHHLLTIKRYNLPIKLDNQHLNVFHHDLFYILPNKFQCVQLSSSSSPILYIEILFVTIYIVSTTSESNVLLFMTCLIFIIGVYQAYVLCICNPNSYLWIRPACFTKDTTDFTCNILRSSSQWRLQNQNVQFFFYKKCSWNKRLNTGR